MIFDQVLVYFSNLLLNKTRTILEIEKHLNNLHFNVIFQLCRKGVVTSHFKFLGVRVIEDIVNMLSDKFLSYLPIING